jgi:hypothetical protein
MQHGVLKAGFEIRSYLFLFIPKLLSVNFDLILACEDTYLTLQTGDAAADGEKHRGRASSSHTGGMGSGDVCTPRGKRRAARRVAFPGYRLAAGHGSEAKRQTDKPMAFFLISFLL